MGDLFAGCSSTIIRRCATSGVKSHRRRRQFTTSVSPIVFAPSSTLSALYGAHPLPLSSNGGGHGLYPSMDLSGFGRMTVIPRFPVIFLLTHAKLCTKVDLMFSSFVNTTMQLFIIIIIYFVHESSISFLINKYNRQGTSQSCTA